MKSSNTKKLIFFSYFLSLFILRQISILSFSFTFLRLIFSEAILWFTGALIGGYFIKVDQLLHVYFTRPDEPLSMQVRTLIDQKKRKQAFQVLKQNVGFQRLAFRSLLFQLAWVILAVFTLTSTASPLGKTLVMAIGLHLLLDEWEDWQGKGRINWLFWQVKREVSLKEQKAYLWLMTIVFSVLSLFLL